MRGGRRGLTKLAGTLAWTFCELWVAVSVVVKTAIDCLADSRRTSIPGVIVQAGICRPVSHARSTCSLPTKCACFRSHQRDSSLDRTGSVCIGKAVPKPTLTVYRTANLLYRSRSAWLAFAMACQAVWCRKRGPPSTEPHENKAYTMADKAVGRLCGELTHSFLALSFFICRSGISCVPGRPWDLP